jgi:hypothetical protein
MSAEQKSPTPWLEVAVEIEPDNTAVAADTDIINILGYKPELRRNRSMFTLLFQSLAIAAVRCSME